MLFRTYTPGPPLCELVEDFRLYEGYSGAHSRERILPSGTFEMVFNLRSDELRIYRPSDREPSRRLRGALVSGPYSRSFMTDTIEEAAILQVHFRPGGAYAVFGIPAGEFANTHLDLETIWGAAASELRERLCTLTEPTARFRLLEQAIMARLPVARPCHPGVRWALQILGHTQGRARIRDIARHAGLSQRRLSELFTVEVGVAPKLFGRLLRFQHAIARARSAEQIDWAQIALDCGYFDQSHLIRDFVEFAGASPSAHRRQQTALDRAGIHVKRHHLPLEE